MLKKSESTDSQPSRELLLRGTEALGLSLSPAQIEGFLSYLDLIQFWNAKFNLTAIRSASLIIRHHFIDSLAIATYINPDKSMVDIGSGAGFPGLPLKIIYPDKEITLIESQRKKINFLKEAVRVLNLDSINLIEGRVAPVPLKRSQLFGEAVARAFGTIDQFLAVSTGLLVKGGQALFMSGPKGSTIFENVKGKCRNQGFTASGLESYTLPIGAEKRTLLIFSKN